VPDGACQRRPSRPRPSCCTSATRTEPCAAPSAAIRARSTLVEPVSATRATDHGAVSPLLPGDDAAAPAAGPSVVTGAQPPREGDEVAPDGVIHGDVGEDRERGRCFAV